MRKELRRNLFYLFAGWSGRFGNSFEASKSFHKDQETANATGTTPDFEFSALQVKIRSTLQVFLRFINLPLLSVHDIGFVLRSLLRRTSLARGRRTLHISGLASQLQRAKGKQNEANFSRLLIGPRSKNEQMKDEFGYYSAHAICT